MKLLKAIGISLLIILLGGATLYGLGTLMLLSVVYLGPYSILVVPGLILFGVLVATIYDEIGDD